MPGFLSRHCNTTAPRVSSGKLQHGVWTYYLLKALRGEVKSALQNARYLTASNLQNYLLKEVPIAANAARTEDHTQTPMLYGAQTGDFNVADIKPLLDKKDVFSAEDPLLVPATFRTKDEVSVKNLSGFKRGNHVPDEIADYADNFIRRIATEDVKGRVEAWAAKFRSALKLKRTNMQVEEDRIVTNDFEYAVWCEQSNTDAGEAVFYEELSKISPAVRTKPIFDELFYEAFDRMVITPSASSNRPPMEVLGPLAETALVEHHTNLQPRHDTRSNQFGVENWDAPLIVTTNVQLLESLFAYRTTSCRKLHNLARSVIVLDEAQTIP